MTAAGLKTALAEFEQIAEIMSKLGSYAGLLTAADTANDAYRRLEDRIQQQLVERENQLTFFELGWLAVDDAVAAKLIEDPLLANYRHHLSSGRRYKPHTLSEPEELLLNQKSLTARAAWTTLCSTNSSRRSNIRWNTTGRGARLHPAGDSGGSITISTRGLP